MEITHDRAQKRGFIRTVSMFRIEVHRKPVSGMPHHKHRCTVNLVDVIRRLKQF